MEYPNAVEYFLGANSSGGFYSLYDQLLPPERARRIYILKGGPGCGKSTLMRRVAQSVEKEGIGVERILCSGDPDSLDGVVIPVLEAALVDGTAPHVVEPKYPGVVERYINLGDCYDSKGLASLRGEIMSCMKGYKGCYQRAYRCLNAAAEIGKDARAILMTEALEQRLAKRAKGILSREMKGKQEGKNGSGVVRQRFLNAVSHRGRIFLYHTVQVQCERVYELADRWGLAHELLTYLLSGLTGSGYDVVACPDPMAPERLAHLIVPELSLAFVSSAPEQPCPAEPYRRIKLDSMADEELLHENRGRLRFARRVSEALMEEGIASLAQAKQMHDDLEKLYNPYVDFGRVEELAREITEELLTL